MQQRRLGQGCGFTIAFFVSFLASHFPSAEEPTRLRWEGACGVFGFLVGLWTFFYMRDEHREEVRIDKWFQESLRENFPSMFRKGDAVEEEEEEVEVDVEDRRK